jgi:hypothetical protein
MCDEWRMDILPRNIVRLLVKAGLAALVANEVRGLILAGPVLYGMYQAGGTAMAAWLAFCSLAGIALSVFAPLFVARKFKLV